MGALWLADDRLAYGREMKKKNRKGVKIYLDNKLIPVSYHNKAVVRKLCAEVHEGAAVNSQETKEVLAISFSRLPPSWTVQDLGNPRYWHLEDPGRTGYHTVRHSDHSRLGKSVLWLPPSISCELQFDTIPNILCQRIV